MMRPPFSFLAFSFLAFFLCVAGLLGSFPLPSYSADTNTDSDMPVEAQTLPKEPVTLHLSKSQSMLLQIEVARGAADRTHGLMGRTSLDEKGGMLFVFDNERPVSMWMKNTHIPLDMLFLNKKGEVVHVHENATPESEEIISSAVPCAAVLELNGGSVKKWAIQKGTRVSHPFFK